MYYEPVPPPYELKEKKNNNQPKRKQACQVTAVYYIKSIQHMNINCGILILRYTVKHQNNYWQKQKILNFFHTRSIKRAIIILHLI